MVSFIWYAFISHDTTNITRYDVTRHYYTISWRESPAVPLLMPWLQGCPKRDLMSGQLALVFHVLANAEAVPSTSPLFTLKSSHIMLLKFPHKPVGWNDTHLYRCKRLYMFVENEEKFQVLNLTDCFICGKNKIKLHIKMWRRLFADSGTIIWRHTRGGSSEWSVSWNEDLHDGGQLDHHLYAHFGTYVDVKRWWPEHTQVRCSSQEISKNSVLRQLPQSVSEIYI